MENTLQQENRIVNIYPLTKFYLALLLAFSGVMVPGIIGKTAIFLMINLLAIMSGSFDIFRKRLVSSIGVLFLILIIIQTLFHPGKRIIFSLWIFEGTFEGFLFALNLGMNLMCVGGALIWFFTVTKEKDFILSLEKKGMNPHVSYVILSTLQMVPILKDKSKVIMDAQRARGVETEGGILVRAKVFVPTIVPLVLSSIAGIEERALTLEARGFSLNNQVTHLYDIEETDADRLLNKLLLITFVLLVIGRIVLWLI